MTQTLIVVAIVALCAAYLGRRAWQSVAAARRARSGPGCGSGGCHH